MRSNPLPPAMFKYSVFFDTAGVVTIVTDRSLDLVDTPKWIKAKEYHVNVHKYYWDTMLKTVYICTKKIAYISFDGYVEPPLKTKEEKE